MAGTTMDAGPVIERLTAIDSTFPSHPIVKAAIEFSQQHTSPMTVNHTLRSALYALHCARKIPPLAATDRLIVVLACIFHDLGWATTGDLVSSDKRFEVDGANAARSWLQQHAVLSLNWGHREIQLVWDAIALHTTESIARYKEAEVALVGMGIVCDFLGPNMPDGLLTEQEHRRIIQSFPRLNMNAELTKIMCGFCATKPETTYDNFVSSFGVAYGLDGHGAGRAEYQQNLEASTPFKLILSPLKDLEERGL